MAGRQSRCVAGSGGSKHVAEIGEVAVDGVGRRRGLSGAGGVIDHSAHGTGFDDYPAGVLFFEVVGDLHAGARWRAAFRAKSDLRVGLLALDGERVHVHIHGGEVERAKRGEVLVDAGADGVRVALLLAAGRWEETGEREDGELKMFMQRLQGDPLLRLALATEVLKRFYRNAHMNRGKLTGLQRRC
jgi:hypothetical protein